MMKRNRKTKIENLGIKYRYSTLTVVSGLDSGSRPGWISVLCCVLGQNTQFSLIVPLFTQEYKWVAGELLGRSDKMLGKGGGLPAFKGPASHPGGD